MEFSKPSHSLVSSMGRIRRGWKQEDYQRHHHKRRSHSGRVHRSRKPETRKGPWVRIPPSAPIIWASSIVECWHKAPAGSWFDSNLVHHTILYRGRSMLWVLRVVLAVLFIIVVMLQWIWKVAISTCQERRKKVGWKSFSVDFLLNKIYYLLL